MQRRDFILQSSRAALLTALSLPAVLSCGNPSTPNQTTEPLAEELEKLIPKIMADAKVPGVSIAIIRDGKLNWQKAFGVKDSNSQAPVNEDTVFEAASVSKTAFAYAVMKLCEKGTIGLDVPLVKYTSKRFIENDPRLDLITARHILSHQSGFQNWRTPEDPLKINFNPGTNFMYSGEGIFLFAVDSNRAYREVNPNECGTYEADVKVCATDIGDYLEQNILKPNKMNASGYIWTDSMKKNAALAHDVDGKLISKNYQTNTDLARYAAAGGLLTSAKDYASFIINLFTPAQNDPFRLNSNSVKEMVRPHVKLPADQKIDGASSWGLGWAIRERPNGNLILHSGGQPGFKSFAMTSLEKKSGFVILTNSDKGGYVIYNEDVEKILNRLFI